MTQRVLVIQLPQMYQPVQDTQLPQMTQLAKLSKLHQITQPGHMTQLPQKIQAVPAARLASNPVGLNDSTAAAHANSTTRQMGQQPQNQIIIIQSRMGSSDPMSQLTRRSQMSTHMQLAQMT